LAWPPTIQISGILWRARSFGRRQEKRHAGLVFSKIVTLYIAFARLVMLAPLPRIFLFAGYLPARTLFRLSRMANAAH
jgi:hypothetical protein